MHIRWFTVPITLAVIVLGWLVLTAGRTYTQLDGEQAWDLYTGRQQVVVIDASEPDLFERGHIPGAVNIDLGEIRERVQDLKRDLPVLVVSTRGDRSIVMANRLILEGFERVYHLRGGIDHWPGPLQESGQ